MTMGKDRGDLGFGVELERLDPDEWSPKPAPAKPRQARPSGTHQAQAAAAASGFTSREPVGQGARRRRRQRRTGRNAQFNIKCTPKAIDEFTEIADAMNWGLGETLEKAIPLLRREFLTDGDQ